MPPGGWCRTRAGPGSTCWTRGRPAETLEAERADREFSGPHPAFRAFVPVINDPREIVVRRLLDTVDVLSVEAGAPAARHDP